ncbi:MAG: alpha/beta hydrolase [Oscillospiraceae bacterium]|jgi:acetyl esterase/lipase|nr:alpha/beta hydrolase [Oscillospiraceae bacterium]
MSRVKINPVDSSLPFALPTLDFSAVTRKWVDVDYTPEKPHPARKLDVYLPEEGDGPFPTIICIHGGAFWGGAKNDFQVAAYMEALDEGFAVASVEQRLCATLPDGSYDPQGRFPNPVYDFKAAIRFLRANAAAYKLDSTRFATAGGSAGGYHAFFAAATADVPALYDASLGFSGVDGRVQAVVDWFGVGDLVTQSQFTEDTPPMKLPNGTEMKMANYADVFLGVNARELPTLAHFANPETWVTPQLPPTLLQHGIADEIVPIECSRRLAKRIDEVCGTGRVILEQFEGYTHGDMRFNSPENIAHMVAFLKDVMR